MNKDDSLKKVDSVGELIRDSTSEAPYSLTLKTDQRVLARVTDGIYRQPGSALRELMANAYDADATRVVVKTDFPRFKKITIEDNGNGMSPHILAYALEHIGGSAKRISDGESLGVTNPNDPTKSPGGRKLIGKIGIGLFSVSQLTHSFQIITKQKGDNFRTVATVILRQYSDLEIAKDKEFESGQVKVWTERAEDVKSHGTSIVLTHIRKQAVETLRFKRRWEEIEQTENNADEYRVLEPPKYHIGRVDETESNLKKTRKGGHDSLPWKPGDDPELAFKKLVDSVWLELNHGDPSPELEKLFDHYLKMVWELSLALPLPYVEKHLFDEPSTTWMDLFLLSNKKNGHAASSQGEKKQTIRKLFALMDPVDDSANFQVFFDDLKLSRPIKYRHLPTTTHALKKPLVFIGRCREEFKTIASELSGGPLAFEAYLFWNPKIVPKEDQGSLIRIHGASGTLFDQSFMRYQVSELTRLRQITCEIFVSEGLESALNIDRESFNTTHPHSVFIATWLHSALRQLATTNKRLSNAAVAEVKLESRKVVISTIQKIANDHWLEETDDPASSPPEVEFVDEDDEKISTKSGAYRFSRARIAARRESKSTKISGKERILEEKLKAIIQILHSYGLLDNMSAKKQNKLAKSIFEILESAD